MKTLKPTDLYSICSFSDKARQRVYWELNTITRESIFATYYHFSYGGRESGAEIVIKYSNKLTYRIDVNLVNDFRNSQNRLISLGAELILPISRTVS
jgi:hypothetical protein